MPEALENAFTRLWDWIDSRDIDKHFVSIAILIGTWRLVDWAMAYVASRTGTSGADIALVVGAVTGPYMALQAAAIKWYFEARSK